MTSIRSWEHDDVADAFGNRAAPTSGGSPAWLSWTGSERAADDAAPCPCGGRPPGASLGACCGPVVEGERPAETAEALMRSRYTAYALADGEHLFRSWHPRTRPPAVEPEPWVRWVRLEVLDVVDGGADDDAGVVEFRASWVAGEGRTRQRGEVHERSRFARRAGRWFYVEPEPDVTGS